MLGGHTLFSFEKIETLFNSLAHDLPYFSIESTAKLIVSLAVLLRVNDHTLEFVQHAVSCH